MAKSQKRSNREVRKPKAAPAKTSQALPPRESASAVQAAMRPKGKL